MGWDLSARLPIARWCGCWLRPSNLQGLCVAALGVSWHCAERSVDGALEQQPADANIGAGARHVRAADPVQERAGLRKKDRGSPRHRWPLPGRLGQSPEGEAPMVQEHTCVLCLSEAAVTAAIPVCVACSALHCLLIFCGDSERAMAD